MNPTLLNDAGTLIECDVIAMQKVIEDAYPEFFWDTPMHILWQVLSYHRDMKISFGEFCEHIENKKKNYSIEYIENVWKDACTFLKQHDTDTYVIAA